MRIELSTPTPDQLDALVKDLASWQQDGLPVICMAVAPSADNDDDLAKVLVRDLEDPARSVLDARQLAVEARFGPARQRLGRQ